MSESDVEEKAIMIRCRGCGYDNWRKGPSFVIMSDYAAGNFECEGCGRRLETERNHDQ